MIRPIRFGVRFLLACTLLMMLAQHFAEPLVSRLFPLYSWEIGALEDRFRVLDFKLDNEGPDRVVRVLITLEKPVFIGTSYLLPDERGHANASTMVASALQPLVLMLALIVAWPVGRVRNLPLRLLVAIPIGMILLMLDLPMVLLGSLWAIIVEHLAPGMFSPLLLWSSFLQGGGKWALGLAGGAMTVWLANILVTALKVGGRQSEQTKSEPLTKVSDQTDIRN